MGFAAEFNGAKLWINVAIAILVCVLGIWPKTWSRSNIKKGLQHNMNTKIWKLFYVVEKIVP